MTDTVSQTLRRPAGQRRLSLQVRMTGLPAYYEVYGLRQGPPALEIASAANWTPDWAACVAPITRGPFVYRESCLPMTTSRAADLTLPLLYPANRITEVIANATGGRLQEGRDWLLRDESLVMPAGSHAPIQLESEFFTVEQETKSGELQTRKTSVRLVEGTWYHERQIEVAYEPAARDWTMPAPLSTLDDLPRLKKHLAANRDAALSIEQPGVAKADVTSAHQAILLRKPFLDTTGNGANHPNDFLHRIYAQRILEVLVP